MNFAMISAVSGGLAALDRLDAITTNLANVSTAGFKSLLHTQVAQEAQRTPASVGNPTTPINQSNIVSDHTQGALETTGNPLHVAIDGPGFFVVDTPQGERLTRRGTFEIDEQGFLVTPAGDRVQGNSGDIELGAAGQRGDAIVIGVDGTVQIGQRTVGTLRIVDGSDADSLSREPGGLYRSAVPEQELVAAEPGSFRLQQGAVEGSNVSAIENLVAMIEAMRGFEAYMSAMDRVDQINERAIRDVGRV